MAGEYGKILAQLALDGETGDPKQLVAKKVLKGKEPPAMAEGGGSDGPQSAADAAAYAQSMDTNVGTQQYDDQGNPYTPPPVAPAKSLSEVLGSKPGVIVPSYDDAGNLVSSGSNGETAIGENQDQSFITQPEPAAPAPSAEAPTEAAAKPTQTISMTGAQAPTPAAPATPVQNFGAHNYGPALDKLLSQQNAGQTALSGVEAQKQADIGVAAGTTNADLQTRQRALDNVTKVTTDKSLAALDAAMAETQKSTAAIDPNRWWNSRSTPQKILAGISMFFSGGGSSPVTTAISNDVAAQRTAAEQHLKAGAQFNTIANSYMEAGHGPREAMQLAAKTLETIQANKAIEIAGKYATPAQQAQLKIDLAKNGFSEIGAKATIAKTSAETAQAQVATATSAFQLQQMHAQADYIKSLGLPPGTDLKNIVHDADGNIGVAMSDEDKKGYLDESQQPAQLVSVVNDIRNLRKDGVVKNQAALQAKSFELQQTLEGMAKNGTLNARTVPQVEKAAGNPAQYWGLLPGANIDNRLTALELEGRSNIKAAENRHGIRFPGRGSQVIKQTRHK